LNESRRDLRLAIRVLLDDKKEISIKTGDAGERVECRIQTPAFAE
jgi:hypothetical protein